MRFSVDKKTLEEKIAIWTALKDIQIPDDILEDAPYNTYTIKPADEILDEVIGDSQVIVVGGADYGDEGKGHTIGTLAQREDITAIIRANSGENAGHTVPDPFGDESFIFHIVPSGILSNKINYIGPECVVDPINLMKELEPVMKWREKHNLGDIDNLRIGNVQLVTPYYKIMDFIGKPALSSTLTGMSPVHAAKSEKRGLRLEQVFLLSKDEQIQRIEKDLRYYKSELIEFAVGEIDKQESNLPGVLSKAIRTAQKARHAFNIYVRDDFSSVEQAVLARCDNLNEQVPGRIPNQVLDFLNVQGGTKEKAEHIYQLYQNTVVNNDQFNSNVTRVDVEGEINSRLANGERILVEPAQSKWLSNRSEQTWNTGTSAQTDMMGTLASTGVNVQYYTPVFLNVFKVPRSRVGLGPNVSGHVDQKWFIKRGIRHKNQLPDLTPFADAIVDAYIDSIGPNGVIEPKIIKIGKNEFLTTEAIQILENQMGGEFGATTKNPRVLSPFDEVLAAATLDLQGPHFSVSAVDRYNSHYKRVPVTRGWRFYHPEGRSMESNGIVYNNFDIIRPGDSIPNSAVMEYCHPIIKLLNGPGSDPTANLSTFESGSGKVLPQWANAYVSEIEFSLGRKHPLDAKQPKPQAFSIGNGPGLNDRLYLRKTT